MPIDIAEEEPVDIFSLPDHIIIHTFKAFSSDLDVLGRCRQVSKRFGALAADEALWRSACDDTFGLTEAVGLTVPRATPFMPPRARGRAS